MGHIPHVHPTLWIQGFLVILHISHPQPENNNGYTDLEIVISIVKIFRPGKNQYDEQRNCKTQDEHVKKSKLIC